MTDLNLRIVSDRRLVEVSYNPQYFLPGCDLERVYEHLADCILNMRIDTQMIGDWVVSDYWEQSGNVVVEFVKEWQRNEDRD